MTKKKTVVRDEFTSEEAFDAASKIEHLLHTPFFGKPPCDSFAQAWASDEIRAKALEFVRDPHAEFHELSEYTDVDNFWGMGLYGSRREGPAIYGSHGAPGVPLMPPALCPVMPGAEIPCDVRATRRYINGYDGEVFVQPAGSLMNLAAAVPGLRVFEKTLARPGVHRFSFNAWALFAFPAPAPETESAQEVLADAAWNHFRMGDKDAFKPEEPSCALIPVMPVSFFKDGRDKALKDYVNGNACTYALHSVIRSVEEMTLLGEKYWKIEAAVDEKDPAAVDTVLPIFCPESIWQGEVPPAVGMRFAGFIWISARFLPEGPLEPLLSRADLLTDAINRAESGDVNAMIELADIYTEGFRVGKDDAEAFRWYKAAAESGSIDGLIGLADCYKEGCGTEKDCEAAKALLLRAGSAGSGEAFKELGDLIHEESHSSEDEKQAHEAYQKAVKLGATDAYASLVIECFTKDFRRKQKDPVPLALQYAAAARKANTDPTTLLMISHLFTVVQDPRLLKPAADLAEKAAESGSATAYFILATYYAHGIGRDPSPRKATQFLKEFGWAGDANQKFEAAQMLLNGDDGFRKDTGTAYHLFEISAYMGSPDGAGGYGYCLVNGIGTKQNIELGLRWLKKARYEGSAKACFEYGQMRMDGRFVRKNRKDGEQWIKRAAEQNLPVALLYLSDGYFYGDVFKQSISQAISWRLRYYAAIPPENAAEDVLNFMDACFDKASEKQMAELAKVVEKAADAGVPEAMVAVGDYYMLGFHGFKEDHDEAFRYYREAASLGNKEAEERIENLKKFLK